MNNVDRISALVCGKNVDVLGAGISNMPAIEFLISLGASVTVRDRSSKERLGERADKLLSLGAKLVLGDDYLSSIDGDVILRSPGIRPDYPSIVAAVSRGAVLTSEMQLFLENAPCPVIAVTGSAGKTTTTTLISMLASEYLTDTGKGTMHLGGNIGKPLLSELPSMTRDDIAVVELSSFQLMTIDAHVECAVITNVTPNHLDWHTGMDEYISAKAKLLAHADRAVLNYSNDITRAYARDFTRPITYFSRSTIENDALPKNSSAVTFEDGYIVKYSGSERTVMLSASDILLPGPHNIENYMAAIAAMGDRDISKPLCRIASTFGGVKHRLEFLRCVNGVKYYNSSIDSAPERTAAALSALPNDNIILICGGYDKHLPYTPLAEAVLKHGKIKSVVYTGATADKIEAAFAQSPAKEATQMIREKCFADAVRRASDIAESGDTVLLSPASASFDEFPNFEVRGDAFRKFVMSL